MTELFLVFFNVIMPVFSIVLLGAVIGGRLQLEARTLTRLAYYVFAPSFVFLATASAQVSFGDGLKMLVFIVLTHLLTVFVAAGLGYLIGRTRKMVAAFIMIASFGNVGNYGIALIRFRLGDQALSSATIYFVAVTLLAFVCCVGAAGWAHGGGRGALWKVMQTPVLWAAVPALLVSAGDLQVPLMLERMIGLLADAMIPVMLFSLGLQLREQGKIHFGCQVLLGSSVRLIIAPLLAWLIVTPFALGPIESASGILQAAMPGAIFISIIAKENDILPEFVTSVVVVSTLLSLVTLSVLMVVL